MSQRGVVAQWIFWYGLVVPEASDGEVDAPAAFESRSGEEREWLAMFARGSWTRPGPQLRGWRGERGGD